MTKQSTELAIVEQLNINGMDEQAAKKLLDAYGVPFTEAGKLIEQGLAIEVTSEEDTENMALARKTRLELRTKRIAIEKKHDELKADSLAYGKAVDLVQRVALEQIKPVEEHLKLQEQYAEVKQEERRQARIAERTAELAKYVDDVSVYNYGDMGDEAFELLLDQVKDAHEKKMAAEKAAEAAKTGYGLSSVDVFVKGVGLGRDTAIRALGAYDIAVNSIKDVTGVPHGGVRPRKARRG